MMNTKMGVAMVVSLLAAACGGQGGDAAQETAQDSTAQVEVKAAEPAVMEGVADDANVVVVRMVDDGTTFKFDPATVEVTQGQVVRFVFEGTQPHNVEFQTVPAGVDLAAFTASPYVMNKGETYEVKIDEKFVPGTYGFICTPHIGMNMKGEIVVKG